MLSAAAVETAVALYSILVPCLLTLLRSYEVRKTRLLICLPAAKLSWVIRRHMVRRSRLLNNIGRQAISSLKKMSWVASKRLGIMRDPQDDKTLREKIYEFADGGGDGREPRRNKH